MNKKKLVLAVSVILCLVFFLNGAGAIPDTITKIFEAYKFNLGNETCSTLLCDRASLFFLIPMDKNWQEADLSIFPSCFVPLNESDTLNLTIDCSDGTHFEYDMKNDYCLSSDHHLDVVLTINGTGGFVFFGENQFQQFWCSFKRNSNNTDAIPTEFAVLVDGVGMHSKYVSNATRENLDTQSAMMVSIKNFVDLDISVWRIGYNLFLIVALCIGIFFIVGAVPLAIQWVIRKITED